MEILPAFDAVKIRVEGTRVLLIREGKVLLNLPWGAAMELSKALRQKGREAEEIEKAEQIIFDGAILDRLGAPLGLSNNPLIRKEVRSEAQWNRALRRYLSRTPSIHSREAVGTPSLIGHPPTPEQERKNGNK